MRQRCAGGRDKVGSGRLQERPELVGLAVEACDLRPGICEKPSDVGFRLRPQRLGALGCLRHHPLAEGGRRRECLPDRLGTRFLHAVAQFPLDAFHHSILATAGFGCKPIGVSCCRMPMRPEDLTISGLPRSPLPGGIKADAAADLLQRAAADYRAALALIEALEAQVASLHVAAAARKDPYELTRTMLESAHQKAQERREEARSESELVLKKAERRAVRIELDAQRRLDDGLAELAQLEAFRGEVSSRLRSTLEAIVALGGEGDHA